MVLGGELHLCKCGMSEGGCQQVHRLPGCCRVVGWNAAGVGVVTTAAALVAAATAAVVAVAAAAGPRRTVQVEGTGTPRRTARATAAVPVGRLARRPRRLQQRTRTAGRLCLGHLPRSCCCPRPGAGGV